MGCVGTTAWMLATPAGAGDEPEPLTLEVSPTSGTFGTEITVQGTGCVSDGEIAPVLYVYLFSPAIEGVDDWDFLEDLPEDGSWSGSVVVSDVAHPAEDYFVSATCFEPADEMNEDDIVLFEYETVPFDVTEPPAATTTTTTTPPNVTPPPATPVEDPPPYTG
jgi:hypothetical protein